MKIRQIHSGNIFLLIPALGVPESHTNTSHSDKSSWTVLQCHWVVQLVKLSERFSPGREVFISSQTFSHLTVITVAVLTYILCCLTSLTTKVVDGLHNKLSQNYKLTVSHFRCVITSLCSEMVESSENPHYLCLQHNVCLNLLLFQKMFFVGCIGQQFLTQQSAKQCELHCKGRIWYIWLQNPGGHRNRSLVNVGCLCFRSFQCQWRLKTTVKEQFNQKF